MGENQELEEAESRKRRSIEILKQHNIPFIRHLPVIGSSCQVEIRSAESIAKRFICSLLAIQHACDILNKADVEESRDCFLEYIRTFGVEQELSGRERKVFTGELSEMDLIQVAWQYEADWVLLWALGIVNELNYPSGICDCDFTVDSVRKHKTFGEFMNMVRIRSIGEILDEADLAFRYDWACVEARIHNKEAPAGLNPEVVVDRHKALNWLIGYGDDWDNLPADT